MDDVAENPLTFSEDVHLAMLEHGQLPSGTTYTPIEGVGGLERVERNGHVLFMLHISRATVEAGAAGAERARAAMLAFPSETNGRTIIACSGWSEDPREIHQIPETVDFLRYLVGGPNQSPDLSLAPPILRVLYDETSDLHLMGLKAFDASGSVWATGICFRDVVYVNTGTGGPILRDVGLAISLRDLLLTG